MASLTKLRTSPCTLHGLGYLALASLLAIWAAVLTLRATGGEMTLPLDDSYIYLQYARGVARGEPFTYQPGAAPSRGATSFLYPFLLAPPAALLSPTGLVWAAWALGIVSLAGTALAADRWAARRLGGGAAWAAGLLTLLSGHLLWGAMSGMEIGLTMLALTGCLAAVPWYLDTPPDAPRARGRLAGVAGWVLFLGLVRPEGILLGGVVAAGLTAARNAPQPRRERALLLAVPLLAAGLVFGSGFLATGTLAGNTLTAKSVLGEPRPDLRAAFLARSPGLALHLTRLLVSEFASPAWGHGTGRLLAVLMGIGGLAGAVLAWTRRGGIPERLLVLVLAAGVAGALLPVAAEIHHHRYEIPYVPLATLLVISGWWTLLRTRPLYVRLFPLVAIGGLLLPGPARYADLVARNAANIHDQHVVLGRWIDTHLPPDAIVAVNDAGAIPYVSRRRIVDLLGLVTNGSTRPARAGQGAVYEWLVSLPPDERPTHFAFFPSLWRYLIQTGVVGRKLAQTTLGEQTISGSDVKAVYEADWSHTAGADRPWTRSDLLDLWDFRIEDEVNVEDLVDQEAHHYESFDTWRDRLRAFPVAGDPGRVLIEGGRQPTRGERFRMRCRPGAPGALVMRTEAFRSFALDVRVDGREIGTWGIPAAPLVWTEPLFEIPGEAFTDTTAEFELHQVPGEPPYPVYRYWLLQ